MKVSVIIPACNHAHCISDAVNSVLGQTYTNREVIVIDDGSEDETGALIKERFPGIIYHRQENLGPAAARNRGILMATGEVVAFLDADDYWESSFLEETVAFLVDNPVCVAVSTGSRFHYPEKEPVIRPEALARGKMGASPFIIDRFFKFWFENDHIFTGTCLIRYSAIHETGLMREELRIAEDLEYWALLATRGRWGFIPHVLWNCNSQQAALQTGWRSKHTKRWKQTPSPELWERRIREYISAEDLPEFEKYKGKLTLSFIYNMIAGGNFRMALSTFRSSRNRLPGGRITSVYSKASLSAVTWYVFATVLLLREKFRH